MIGSSGAKRARQAPAKPRGAAARLLLVEHDRDFAQLLQEGLAGESNGALEVLQRGCLATALACLEEQSFDLILLDLDLPDSAGPDSADMLLRQVRDTPSLSLGESRNCRAAPAAARCGPKAYR